MRYDLGETARTSQRFRMAERPPITDLSGGNTSEDSFTRSIATLTPAYVVDFQSDSVLGAALGSIVRPEASGRPLWSFPGTCRFSSASVSGSALQNGTQMDLPGQSGLHTVRFLVTRGQRARRWHSRGTNPKIWNWFRGAWCGRVAFGLTFDGIDTVGGFREVASVKSGNT